MQLRIRTEGFRLTGAISDFVQTRVRYALGRFHGLIEQVQVRLRDDNGPRGGVDKRCHLQVRMRGLQPLLIDERDGDLYAAIGRGTQRAERQVARTLARRRALLRHG